jgi:hypothetical protein
MEGDIYLPELDKCWSNYSRKDIYIGYQFGGVYNGVANMIEHLIGNDAVA